MSTMVLVPGAGGDAWNWHRVEPLLREHGHDVVAVDLPGADPAAGLPEYADLVTEAVRGRDDVVLVAHSLGGLSAPIAASRVPVRELVLVNAMIPAPGEDGGTWWTATGQGPAARACAVAEGRDPNAAFDPVEIFLHDLDAETLAATLARPDPAQSDTVFATPWPLDRWPDVPTRVIVGVRDRLFPADFQRRVARERLGVETVHEIDAGHLPALSRPVELVEALLERAERPQAGNASSGSRWSCG